MVRKFTLIVLFVLVASSCNAITPHPGADRTETGEQVENNISSPGATLPTKDLPANNIPLTRSTLNRILPENIIQEIGFFGGLGGGDWGCPNIDDRTPNFLSMSDYPRQWMTPIQITVCGISLPEEVQVNIGFPDGTIEEASLPAVQTEGRNTGEVTFEYLPLVHSPTGEYIIVFSGSTWELEYPLTIIEPPQATLYEYESQLFLVNFSPNETMRLFVYETGDSLNLKLIGWNEYQVNQSGDLDLSTDFQEATYIAIGEMSGQVSMETADIYCAGSRKPSGIVPMGYAEVLVDHLPAYHFDANQNKWIRGSDQKIGRGTVVQVVSNARCSDQTFLWELNCPDYSCTWGMMPESGPDGYYLRPLQKLPPANTPDPASIPACPGTQPTRLRVGMNAEVTTSGMAPQLSLRAQPGMSAEKVHVIAAGRDLVILQGPMCADNSYWWYIQSEQGFEGWAREGDNEDYWIDPLP